MLIAIDHANAGQPCVVHLDDYLVPFASHDQAEAFVSQLRKRIAAPHALPRLPRSTVAGKFRRSERTVEPRDKSA